MTDAELDHRAEVARIDGNYLALELIRELRQLHTRVEAMAAVVAGAQEAYAELGELDMRVGEIIDEDDVRCWQAHERAIGEPLRQYLASCRAKVQR